MNIKPLGDRVLVEVMETETTTQSGIVLPESSKEKKAEGTVVAVGAGEDVAKLGLNIGDVVIFGKYSGDEVEVDGKEYKIIKDEEVLAVITK